MSAATEARGFVPVGRPGRLGVPKHDVGTEGLNSAVRLFVRLVKQTSRLVRGVINSVLLVAHFSNDGTIVCRVLVKFWRASTIFPKFASGAERSSGDVGDWKQKKYDFW